MNNNDNNESDSDINCNRYAQYSQLRINKETERTGNNSNGDHPNDRTVKIGQNTEKSHGDLRRLAFTQTSVKDHQLMLMWKTLKGVNEL